MADQCIVCLENLDSAVPLPQLQRQLEEEDDHGGGGPAAAGAGAAPTPPAAKSTTTSDVSLADLPIAVAGATLTLSANGKDKTPETADSTTKKDDADADDNNIAIIQVCGHILHDSCLKAWTVKANSCPICRQTFHNVQVYDQIGGKLLFSTAPPELGIFFTPQKQELTFLGPDRNPLELLRSRRQETSCRVRPPRLARREPRGRGGTSHALPDLQHGRK